MICTKYYISNQKQPNCVEVKMEGVPATGIIDAGSDVTLSEVIYSITYVVDTAEWRKVDLNLQT